jgi:hypothetical protein
MNRHLHRWALVGAVALGACSGSADVKSASVTVPIATTIVAETQPSTSISAPAALQPAVLSGRASLDGSPVDTEFVGAVVRDNQLITPCQLDLPPIDAGRFEITVLSAEGSAGCGHPGAEVILWIYVGDVKVFATTAVAWPASGRADVTLDFSAANPIGAAAPAVELFGEVFRADGQRVASGVRVEAYIGDTLCGVGSIRNSGSFDGYLLSIVGPGSIAQCLDGATVTFRVDGTNAEETTTNSQRPNPAGSFNLTVG